MDKLWLDKEAWDVLERSLRPEAREGLARSGHLRYLHHGVKYEYLLITTYWKDVAGSPIMAIRGEKPKDI